MFPLDPADPSPAEAQLVRSVHAAIDAGLLAAGEPLPTVRRLAVELRVNANAVERAYAELTQAGVLEHRPGEGTFVRGASPEEQMRRSERLARLEDEFLERAAALGFSLDEVIIHLDGRRR